MAAKTLEWGGGWDGCGGGFSGLWPLILVVLLIVLGFTVWGFMGGWCGLGAGGWW
ncbi:MAG: sporulation protein YjcZ [Bacillota bacterium]